MLRTCKFDMCIVVLNYYGEDRPNHTTQQERYCVAPWDRASLIRLADAYLSGWMAGVAAGFASYTARGRLSIRTIRA